MSKESRSPLNDSSQIDSIDLIKLDSRTPSKKSVDTKASLSQILPFPRHKRTKTVRDITKDFESHLSLLRTSNSFREQKKSSQSRLSEESEDSDKENRKISDQQKKKYKRRSRSFGDKESSANNCHTGRTSVLLASARFPSTLKTTNEVESPYRARTISCQSHLAGLRNTTSSLKLASAAYPTSYSSKLGPGPSHLSSSANSDVMAVGAHSARMTPVMSLPTLSISHEEDENLDKSTNSFPKVQIGDEEDGDEVTELSSCPASPERSSLSAMTASERREHSRKHSRVHSRNLSVFFPQPGSEAESEVDYIKARNQYGKPIMSLELDQISNRDGQDGTKDGQGATSDGNLSPTKSRRGHHRKHSVNHGLLNVTNTHFVEEAISPKTTRFVIQDQSFPSQQHKKTADFSDYGVDNVERSVRTRRRPFSRHLQMTSLSSQHGLLLIYGSLEFILGATLWWKGQSGDSLSLTGLGYLVVFDAFGILNAIAAEISSHGSIRQEEFNTSKDAFKKAYSPFRIETVLQFSQTVYLLFASIYVCKESVEHALLESEDGHHEEDDSGLYLPRLLLILSSAFCLFSIMVLHNHDKLVAACGIATSSTDKGTSSAAAFHRKGSHGRRNSILVDPSTLAGPFINLLANPFSITIVFFCLSLSIASIIMPPFQVAALDKVLAGLESVTMLYIAYPASVALGKILLQTAPKSYNTQNVQLMRSLQTIGEHPLVTYVAPPHLWQLTPPTSAINQQGKGPSNSSSLLGNQRIAKNAALIAMVQIFLKEEASDESVLQLTKWAWSLLAPAVGAGAGLRAGESLRGSIRAGEVVISVNREGQRNKYRLEEREIQQDYNDPCHGREDAHDHHHHSHLQHTHNHNNDHKHDHAHIHSHRNHHHSSRADQ